MVAYEEVEKKQNMNEIKLCNKNFTSFCPIFPISIYLLFIYSFQISSKINLMLFLSSSFMFVALILFAFVNLIFGSLRPFDVHKLQMPGQEVRPLYRSIRSRIERRDRPCLINAGLSQGCDLSDILYAKYQANKFSSFAGPGRR